MFYDLNIALPESAGRPKGHVSGQDWTHVAQTIEQAREFGYDVVAINQTVQGKLVPEHLEIWKSAPVISGAIYSWNKETGARISANTTGRIQRGGVRVLRRLTLVVSDASHGQSLASSVSGVVGEYDIVAVRPTSEKLLLSASSGVWDAVDLISLDMGSRWGFFAKHKTVGQALGAGYAFEISYKPALTDSATRQQWVSNAASIIRVTRGKGVVWTSGACQAFDVRAPCDVVALGEVLQLNSDLSKRALSSNSRAVLLHAFTRASTLKAVISVKQADSAINDDSTEPASKRAKK
ncbi:RNA-binding RNA processing protein rpp1 [Coemansia spiralis]|uniref:RNA-binding RNA processing protein rpp1 n=2 Tax=Coemansia TaxID=4863 RepID=A0A9W8GEG7_9FUNG|nr:RNase P subunit p30-domain-containing protein [Coemansia spiralis]KAJ1995984.1 RNA-binding RNA processing protein rpp1 [Coemansia umbellata]KAJ2625428.1 RNA-binding RNA processing protein rpp1 [Coemansia sp. RSA 1358]KAJ2680551.1 RNA-binding RNA processing protein rpp1 [Coemansia spiralis]